MPTITIDSNIEEFLEQGELFRDRLFDAVAVGLAAGIQSILGDINAEVIGPREWTQPDRDDISPLAYAVATNIAKLEGHTDFSRTNKGSGFLRVQELAPKMPYDDGGKVEPGGRQVIWIQSGRLRTTSDYGVTGQTGIEIDRGAKDIKPGSDDIAVGFLAFMQDYALKLEQQFNFVDDTVDLHIQQRTIERHIEAVVGALSGGEF